MKDADARPFRAYISRKQVIVVVAAFLPMLVLFTWNLPLHPDLPMAGRLAFFVLILPVALMVAAPLRSLFWTGPVLEVAPDGFVWRNWSDQPIPWAAVESWRVKRYLGFNFVTLWLKEPEKYRPTTVSGWLQGSNTWLGFGTIAINTGGTNRSFEQLFAAFSQFSKLAPMPTQARARHLP